jgi:hypothetical protein
MDGLVLFEACLSGKLHHVPRRPHDRERSSLIKSGSIFIYEENASGIKRWTDGVAWSPSRILGNFLIYRELEKPFPPGEKKRAMKRKRTSIPGEPYPRRDSDENEGQQELPTPLTPPTPHVDGEAKPEVPSTDQDKELERSLIGSLVDSYGFRPEGLVKKTMSISVNGISHHMVSYYKVDDVKNNLLPRPLSDPRLQNISVRPELYLKQNFRAPVEETEHYAIDGHMNAHPQMMYSSMQGGYGVPQGQYFQQGRPYPGMYSMPSSSGAMPYGGMTGTSWPTQQAPTAPMPYGGHQQHQQQQHQPQQHQQHQPYGAQSYGSYYKPEQQSNGSSVKSESQQPQSQYGNQYASSPYPAMPQRSGSQSTPSMMQPPYQTPTQQQPGSSTFGSMASNNNGQRSVYDSPTTAQQPHSAYGASQSQYAVRSPTTQSYGANQPTQSPHPSVKSPQSGTPAQPNDQHSAYRGGSYPQHPPTPQSAHPSSGEMNGLGISNNTSSYPPPPPQNGHSHAYGSSAQPQTAGPYAS